MFIIHKNRNNTSIQPILKLNYPSFMFNNIFCEINTKKVIHLEGGGRGNGGTVLMSFWKCNHSIYLDIQVYYLDIHTFMPSIGSWCVIINFSIIQVIFRFSSRHLPEKWHFRSLQSLLLPQFSTYRHRTGFIVKRKQVVRIQNYLRIPINFKVFFYRFLKLFILPKIIHVFQKNS